MQSELNLSVRLRRLRLNSIMRQSLQSVSLERRHIIVPVFVCEGQKVRRSVGSMPGIDQMSVDVAGDYLESLAGKGFGSYIIFGVIEQEKKDDKGSPALDEDNVVCRLIRETKGRKLPMLAMTDLCFCEYTSHGHCGVMTSDGTTVQNDLTVQRLVWQALSHAKAGADVIAPSGMMDGTVGALRAGLDAAGFADVAVLS